MNGNAAFALLSNCKPQTSFALNKIILITILESPLLPAHVAGAK